MLDVGLGAMQTVIDGNILTLYIADQSSGSTADLPQCVASHIPSVF